MTNYTKLMTLGLFFILAAPVWASAEEAVAGSPVGQWLVKDKTAHIRIVPCGSKLWGVISWVSEAATDKNNPDPARRNDPVLGLPILLGFEAGEEGEWNGRIYNAQNGKIYDSHIRLTSDDVLHVSGCVLGILCGGEDWTRLAPAPASESADKICARLR